MNSQICPKCEVPVAWTLDECPTCKTKRSGFIFSNSPSSEDKNESDQVFKTNKLNSKSKNKSDADLTLADVVRAQNRTTHAIRAFVRFLFIQLTATTLGIFLWNISNQFIDQQRCFNTGDHCSGNGFFRFLAVMTILVGIFWSSNAGWSELSKSEIH